jgi:type I restriction enzyme R subunit
VTLKAEVDHVGKMRDEVRLNSGDYVDLKLYEPAMRHLIDTYIRAEESEKISAFDDMNLIQLIVERGPAEAEAKLKGIMKTEEAVAETIENNVRKLIINESPVDPAYYDKMSKLLDALIALRRKGVISYKAYLEKIAALTKDVVIPGDGIGAYPPALQLVAQRALYNNLGRDEALALAVDAAIMGSLQSDWKTNAMKTKRVRLAIKEVMVKVAAQPVAVNTVAQDAETSGYTVEVTTDRVLELAKHQHDY